MFWIELNIEDLTGWMIKAIPKDPQFSNLREFGVILKDHVSYKEWDSNVDEYREVDESLTVISSDSEENALKYYKHFKDEALTTGNVPTDMWMYSQNDFFPLYKVTDEMLEKIAGKEVKSNEYSYTDGSDVDQENFDQGQSEWHKELFPFMKDQFPGEDEVPLKFIENPNTKSITELDHPDNKAWNGKSSSLNKLSWTEVEDLRGWMVKAISKNPFVFDQYGVILSFTPSEKKLDDFKRDAKVWSFWYDKEDLARHAYEESTSNRPDYLFKSEYDFCPLYEVKNNVKFSWEEFKVVVVVVPSFSSILRALCDRQLA